MITKLQKLAGYSLGILAVFIMFGFVYWYAHEEPVEEPISAESTSVDIKPELLLKVDKEDILESKEVDWIVNVKDENGLPTGEIVNKGKIIKYDYISNVEVSTSTITIKNGAKDKIITEKVDKRTGNAKFFETGNIINGKEEMVGQFYSGTPFIKQGDKWYHSETATTSIEAFEEQTKVSFKRLFGKRTLAAPIYSGAGDGDIDCSLQSSDWDTVHNRTTAAGCLNGTNYELAYAYGGAVKFEVGGYGDKRIFLPFDTSSIPSGNTITSTTLYAYVKTVSLGEQYAGVIETSQASHTSLVDADYNQCGAVDSPDEGTDSRTTLPTGVINAYKTWALNSTGKSWVKINGAASSCGDSLTGWTCLGLRDSKSIDDTEPTTNYYYDISNSEETGTAQDPYLTVTYEEAAVPESDSGSHPVIWFD